MRIRKITIHNFRNLRNVEVLPRNPMVLCGENNTGKTNMLFALRLLLGTDSARLSQDLSEEDINDYARSLGENWFKLTIQIGELQHHQELEALFRDHLELDGEETFITIQGEFRKLDDGTFEWNVSILPSANRKNDPVSFNPRMAHLIPLFYLNAIRDANVEMRPTGRSMLADAISQIDFSDVRDDMIEGIRAANLALGGNESIRVFSEDITKLLNSNIPGGNGKVSLGVTSDDPIQITKGIRLSLQRELGGRSYDISRHGTGLQNMVLIALFRYLLHKDPMAQAILAIEEPEAHLHVNAQRTMFNELAKIENPVLITTHSPTLVSCANPISLVRLTYEEGGIVVAHQLNPDAFGAVDRSLFARMMRSGRSDAIFARVILLVEGPCEVNAVPAFASSLGYDLDRDGVSVISADSNAFSFVLRACDKDNFSIPTVVIFDADALESSDNLLKEAKKAGKISDYHSTNGESVPIAAKISILESIGWFAARMNFEEEVASSGYTDIILEVIKKTGLTGSFEDFLDKNKMKITPQSIAEFLRKTRKGGSIKVAVSLEIAEKAKEIQNVPECYKNAIEKAIELALQ